MKKARLTRWLPVVLCGIACYILFSAPAVCTRGVREGLVLCGNTVIPSLFPFMCISGFLVRSGLCEAFGRVAAPVTTRLFRLSGESAGVILMSLVGGFPIGVKMAAQLYDTGRIGEEEAKRVCLFCMNAGPAFVITAVGSAVLGSVRAGVILYSSLCLSALLLGIGCRFLAKEKLPSAQKGRPVFLHNPATALSQAVKEAMSSMLQICAWVVLFGALGAYIDTLPFSPRTDLLINCILEVTGGVNAAAGRLSLPANAAVLAFSGLSVHCQVLGDLKHCGVRYGAFLAARIAAAALSAGACAVLLHFFPCEISAFAGSGDLIPVAYSVSVPSFAALMLMSILLILEVEPNRKVC